MTARVLRAIECRCVDILGHPTGRLLLRREPAPSTWRGSSGRGRGTAWRWKSTARWIGWT